MKSRMFRCHRRKKKRSRTVCRGGRELLRVFRNQIWSLHYPPSLCTVLPCTALRCTALCPGVIGLMPKLPPEPKSQVYGSKTVYRRKWAVGTLHCALRTMHCALCTVQCSLCTVQCSLCTVHERVYSEYCSVQCKLCKVHCAVYITVQ